MGDNNKDKKQKNSESNDNNIDKKASPLFASNDEETPKDPLAAPADRTNKKKTSSSPPTSKVEMVVEGMTCSMCVKAITRAVQIVPGVQNITISLATNVATIEGYAPVSAIQNTIEDLGYDVKEVMHIPNNDQHHEEQASRLERIRQRQEEHVRGRRNAFLWSLAGTIPIFIITMCLPPFNVTIKIFYQSYSLEELILFFLASAVQFGSGWIFYIMSYHNLQSRVLGMDVLVALGTTASYGYALTGKYHFYETSAVLVSFVLLGKWMNAMAVRRTGEALERLMQLQCKTAIRVTRSPVTTVNTEDDNNMEEEANKDDETVEAGNLGPWDPLNDSYHEETVPIEQVYPGDMVKVLRGSSIPADGVVAFGEMSVDESRITGESIPAVKTKGSVVLGGTVCLECQDAATFVTVKGVGSSTALAQIVRLVQEAQTRQVPIQSLADAISSVFVPTVATISILTFMVWYALCSTNIVPLDWYQNEGAMTFSLMFGIACLVISCPCALGLATPTAVMVGTGVGARHGVLMKGGEALEVSSEVDTVIFDKTGTLTQGKPAVTDFIRIKQAAVHDDYSSAEPTTEEEVMFLSDEELLWLLGSLERNSEHPLAKAVVNYAEATLDPQYLEQMPFSQPTDFKALTGRGASGYIAFRDATVAVGNRAFASTMGFDIPLQAEECMKRLEQQGKTAVVASVNNKTVVVIGIADELKPDAAASVAFLRQKLDIDVWIVTGDNSRTANAIAEKLNLPLDRVISEALPATKVHQVRKLQAQDKIVAMIGDGINDSPALAEANVGMSLGTGAEIAAEASDMVLVRGHVEDVCIALDFSRVLFRRIQWNFVWALVYNCLGIPIAAGVFYPLILTSLPPTVAALAMALSSVSVVFSSLALRWYRPPNVQVFYNNTSRQQEQESPFRTIYEINATDNDLTEPLLENNDGIEVSGIV